MRGPSPRFRPLDMFRVLAAHGVDYVVIGGLAAVFQGSPIRTGDVDLCPETSRANLERLAGALAELAADLRTETGERVPFARDADFLARMAALTLTTECGDLDVCFVPAGTGGYADLVRHVVLCEVEEVEVPVADIADVIRSKEACGRDKDRETLPALRVLAQEIARAEAAEDS